MGMGGIFLCGIFLCGGEGGGLVGSGDGVGINRKGGGWW